MESQPQDRRSQPQYKTVQQEMTIHINLCVVSSKFIHRMMERVFEDLGTLGTYFLLHSLLNC